MITREKCPLLLVVSAPSGAGKTTLCERLSKEFAAMKYSVSCTTRAPRRGEADGVNYHFINEKTFLDRVEAGAFLEHARVHGFLYGTLRDAVMTSLSRGEDVLMDIDVQGAAQIRDTIARLPDDHVLRRAYVDIFVAPPSLDVLKDRLRRREKDSEEVIARRIQQAERELACWSLYDYLIINDQLDDAADILRSIVLAEHHRCLK